MNITTGYVNPQYHCVYDNTFSTVPTMGNGGLFDDNELFHVDKWNQLIATEYELSFELEYDAAGNLIPGPVLQEDWLTGPKLTGFAVLAYTRSGICPL